MASKSNNGTYQGIDYESQEELFILWYFFELKEAGIVKSIERGESFNLSDERSEKYYETKQLKTKTKKIEKKVTLLREHVYTPDLKVTWNKDIYSKFITGGITFTKYIPFYYTTCEFGNPVTYVEIKPDFNLSNNMERIFIINQKWTYNKFKVYVNLVKPKELFEKTFTPELYTKTATGKEKKQTFTFRSLNQFLNDNTN